MIILFADTGNKPAPEGRYINSPSAVSLSMLRRSGTKPAHHGYENSNTCFAIHVPEYGTSGSIPNV